MSSKLFVENDLEKLFQCPHCSSEDLLFLFQAPDRLAGKPGIFYLEKCARCGLIFQNPRVKQENIAFYYDSAPYISLPIAQAEPRKFGFQQWIKTKTLTEHFYYPLAKKNLLFYFLTFPFKRFLKIKAFPNFQPQGKLLEIGCSNGEFLAELKSLGWRAKGVEMSRASSDFGRSIRGLDIENKKIEECRFNFQEFDAIVMLMVLEHLYQPFDALKRITSWLKKEGQLIFSIPYFQGFEFQWFKSYAYGLQTPTHITFFTKKIIKDYLKKLGYRDIRFYFHFFDRDIVASAHYKYQDTKSWFYKIIANNKLVRFLAVKPFVFLLAVFGKSSRVTICASLK